MPAELWFDALFEFLFSLLVLAGLSYRFESHHAWQLAHGEFSVGVGDSSADTPLAATFTIR